MDDATTTTGTAFDDSDALGQYLQDTKASDKIRLSKIADARAVVQDFRGNDAAGAWPSLDRATVADRLLDLLGPETGDDQTTADVAGRAVFQGSLNLCGPAAFFNLVIKRHPVMFANFATHLFETGSASLGSLVVTPGQDILSADYASLVQRMQNGVTPQADFMALGALRNSTNAFFTGDFKGDPDQVLAAGTRPDELTSWLTQTGIYGTVSNQANWMQCAGYPHAEGLSLSEGVDVVPLIHVNLINAARNLQPEKNWPLTEFPNHWVVLIGQVAHDVTADKVFFNIWSWGSSQNLDVPQNAFYDNYYGALIATLNS